MSSRRSPARRRPRPSCHAARHLPCSIEPLEQRMLLYAGDILAVCDVNGTISEVRDYTQDGQRAAVVRIPGDDGRDLAVDPNGNIQLWQGTFDPKLVAHQGPLTGTGGWVTEATTQQVPQWSTINRTFYGGVAVYGQYVFATDQKTGNDNPGNGLIRFDANNNYAPTRFASGMDFSDVTLGMDGKLYAMNGGQAFQPQVWIYDPISLQLIRSVTVPGFDNSTVAADSDGNIYVGSFSDDKTWKLSPTGQILKSIDVEARTWISPPRTSF